MTHRILMTALFLGATALASTACSYAADSSGGDRPPVLGQLESQGLEIVNEFPAGDGLRAFAAVAGQQPMAVYVTAGGDAIVGTRISVDGKKMDVARLQDLVAKPMTNRVWKQLEKSTWVRDGREDAPRVIYLFSDPNCPYCHQLWTAARPWVESGKVQLRHVMVGVIREDSANKVASILGASDRSAAFERNELDFAQGGIKPAASVPAAVRRMLDANEQLMLELGFRGTPGVVFKDDNGLMQQRSGMPRGADLEVVLGRR